MSMTDDQRRKLKEIRGHHEKAEREFLRYPDTKNLNVLVDLDVPWLFRLVDQLDAPDE